MTNRPISPHLQVYKPQLTSVLSILHRISGVFLSLGIPFLVFWLWSLSQGPDVFEQARAVFGSVLGRVFLFAWSFSFFYHLCNGVRHLLWDVGKGFDLDTVYRTGWAVVAGSVIITIATWAIAYAARAGS